VATVTFLKESARRANFVKMSTQSMLHLGRSRRELVKKRTMVQLLPKKIPLKFNEDNLANVPDFTIGE
jgi:hypothetical protein